MIIFAETSPAQTRLYYHLITSTHMTHSESFGALEEYHTPSVRIVDLRQETVFLASNLEPIDGGSDPDIDW